MTIIFFRATVLLITLIVVMRLMGKRQIGEMQPFEFIITLLIAELACIPMSDVSIPLIYGVVSVLAVFIIHQLLTILSLKSVFIRHAVCGKPSVVINKDGVDMKSLIFIEWNKYKNDYFERKVLVFYEKPFPEFAEKATVRYVTQGNVLISYEILN